MTFGPMSGCEVWALAHDLSEVGKQSEVAFGLLGLTSLRQWFRLCLVWPLRQDLRFEFRPHSKNICHQEVEPAVSSIGSCSGSSSDTDSDADDSKDSESSSADSDINSSSQSTGPENSSSNSQSTCPTLSEGLVDPDVRKLSDMIRKQTVAELLSCIPPLPELNTLDLPSAPDVPLHVKFGIAPPPPPVPPPLPYTAFSSTFLGVLPPPPPVPLSPKPPVASNGQQRKVVTGAGRARRLRNKRAIQEGRCPNTLNEEARRCRKTTPCCTGK